MNNSHKRWWQAPKDQVHEQVVSYLKNLESSQSGRAEDNLRYMRLYGNYDYMGIDSLSYSRAESSVAVSNRVTLNVIQNMVDTVVSKITKNRPKPMFLTSGGDWTMQQKAQKLTKFVEGIFHSSGIYQEANMAFLDACIFGTGAIKFYIENNQIKAERVFINEIRIDESEAFYSKPRQIHQTKFVHKDVLKAMFPEKENLIDEANKSDESNYRGSQMLESELIRVVESWHLPSGDTTDSKGKPIEHDGKHTICVSNCTLLSEPWDKKYFPFIFLRWGLRPVGFFGQGIAEQLLGLQLEINKILRTIQVSMHLTCVPKVFIEASSKVVSAHLNNKIGAIVKYAGTKPIYESTGAISPELFAHLDRLYSRAYEIIGVSQLSAQSQKPNGLDSGKALRTFNDIESERFMSVGQRYERAFIDASEIIVDMARDLYDQIGELGVKVKGKKFLETIRWEDVDMEEDMYLMDVFPVSSLASSPSGRMQDVQDLAQAGFISKEQAIKLLNFPDLDSAYNLINASMDDIESMVERMVVDGSYETPEPYQNLDMGLRMVQQAYLYYKSQNCDEDRLELLRRWMEDAQAILLKSEQTTPTPNQLVQQMTQAGNDGAAQTALQIAGASGMPANPLIEGGISLQPPMDPAAMPVDPAAMPVAPPEGVPQA